MWYRFDKNNRSTIYFNPLKYQTVTGVQSVRICKMGEGTRQATKDEVLGVIEIVCGRCGRVPQFTMHANIIKMAMNYIEREG